MKKRIFMCGLQQESNCFNPVLMTLESFAPDKEETADYREYIGAEAFLSDKNVDIIWGAHMRSASGSPLADEVVNYFINDTLERIKSAGSLDGILLFLHGATMSESVDDVCGYICEKVRKAVGEQVVISASFDMHGNVTERIAKNVNCLCGYRLYPHIDQEETGERAAKLLWDILSGKEYKMARAAIPMMAPAHAYTTARGALKELNEKAQAFIASGKIVEYSVFQVQPWLDHPEVESAVIVIAKDEQAALDVANELAKDNFNSRKELQGKPLFSVNEVIEKALANKSGKPIILVDSADSIGAGSTGDSASVVEALLPYADKLKAATAVKDVAAVAKAFEVGEGKTAEFTFGASISPKLSSPVTVTAKVRGLYDGNFELRGPLNKGARVCTQRTAVLEVGGIFIRISEHPCSEGDVNYFNSFGIKVEECDLVSVKACTSFRAGYEPIAEEICNSSTRGAACPDILALPFERLPKPTYPFDEITEDDIYPAKIYR